MSSRSITAVRRALLWVVLLVVLAGTDRARASLSPAEDTRLTGSHAEVSPLAASDVQGWSLFASADLKPSDADGGVGGALYVAPGGSDINPGTPDHPLASLQTAADRATPGSVVHVAPGSYSEPIVSTSSGTAASPIRYVSDVRWGAKLRSRGGRFSWQNYGDWVSIEDFDVAGDGAQGIYSEGSHVLILGNHVHHIAGPGCDDNGGAGITLGGYTSTDNDVISNLVHDIGDFAGKCPRVHGIYHSTLRGRVQGNIVYRIPGWGIHTWHAASQLVISNNLVFNSGNGGILVGAGDLPGGVVADGFMVANNILIDNPYGILEFGHVGRNEYLSNVVYRDHDAIVLKSPSTVANTRDTDPQFVDYRPDGGGDYHLKATSPLVNAGAQIGVSLLDFDGAPRTRSAPISIGPYP